MAAVIFDLDGTLIDSVPDIHAVTNRILSEEGIGLLSIDRVRSFIGRGLPHLVSCLMEETGQGDDPARHAALVDRFALSYETAVGLTVTYPGVIKALDALAVAGHRLAICTNKPLAPARAVLAHLGLLERFDAVIGGDSLPQRKPDPAPLLHTLGLLGGGVAAYVGDSEVDAETAERAGMAFALYTEGYRKSPVEALTHAAAFDDWHRLPGIVEAIAR